MCVCVYIYIYIYIYMYVYDLQKSRIDFCRLSKAYDVHGYIVLAQSSSPFDEFVRLLPHEPL
jgi:hypothetical protein